MQRYLDQILEAALSQTYQIQSAAVDILTFTVKQGLAHPLQSFPIIVALETSPSNFGARASALHAILHAKHTSLLNARYVHSARASFDYQKRLNTETVKGYRLTPAPTALLHRWYTLAREKRATRQDFLRALVKVFDIELSKPTQVRHLYRGSSFHLLNIIPQDDVDFVRYMAENFSAFEYKTQEEVLTVIKSLTSVLSTAGMQLVETLSPSHLLAQLHGPSYSQPGPAQIPVQETPMNVDTSILQADVVQPRTPPPAVPPCQAPIHDFGTLRGSVIVAMIMLLKAHLKTLYALSEE